MQNRNVTTFDDDEFDDLSTEPEAVVEPEEETSSIRSIQYLLTLGKQRGFVTEGEILELDHLLRRGVLHEAAHREDAEGRMARLVDLDAAEDVLQERVGGHRLHSG